jgi:hypothetical protein
MSNLHAPARIPPAHTAKLADTDRCCVRQRVFGHLELEGDRITEFQTKKTRRPARDGSTALFFVLETGSVSDYIGRRTITAWEREAVCSAWRAKGQN